MSAAPDSTPRPVAGAPDDVTERLFIPPQYQQPRPGGPGLAPVPQGVVDQQAPVGLAMKSRNPVGVWLGLPLITFGIYTYVWYYKIHREMADFDRRRALPVAGPMLVLLFLGWTFVAPLVSLYNTGNRIADAQRAAGLRVTCSAGIGLLLCFVFGLVSLYYQSELNKVVDAYGAPAGATVPLRG